MTVRLYLDVISLEERLRLFCSENDLNRWLISAFLDDSLDHSVAIYKIKMQQNKSFADYNCEILFEPKPDATVKLSRLNSDFRFCKIKLKKTIHEKS